jgi:hypothetical protein
VTSRAINSALVGRGAVCWLHVIGRSPFFQNVWGELIQQPPRSTSNSPSALRLAYANLRVTPQAELCRKSSIWLAQTARTLAISRRALEDGAAKTSGRVRTFLRSRN